MTDHLSLSTGGLCIVHILKLNNIKHSCHLSLALSKWNSMQGINWGSHADGVFLFAILRGFSHDTTERWVAMRILCNLFLNTKAAASFCKQMVCVELSEFSQWKKYLILLSQLMLKLVFSCNLILTIKPFYKILFPLQ